MNKIFCNKETDIVEQILEIREGEVIADDYFSNCYAVDDLEEKVNGYNLRYNKEIKEFEVVEGLNAKDEVVVLKAPTTEDYNNLKEENKDLKSRIQSLENLELQKAGLI